MVRRCTLSLPAQLQPSALLPLLVGDDGQHDDALYTAFTIAHPDNVAGVAIRRLTPAEAVLAGGRTAVDDHSAASVPWVTGDDGAALMKKLAGVGLVSGR